MDLDELKSFTERALDFSIDFLRKHGLLHPMFQILSATGVDLVTLEATAKSEGDWVAAKNALAAQVRTIVREKQASAVVHVDDAWVIQLDQAHPLASLARTRKYSTEQLERMGIGNRRDVLTAWLETPANALKAAFSASSTSFSHS